jgi:hypothetical protein
MHFLLVTASAAATRQAPTVQPSAVTVEAEADIPRNLPRNLPLGACLTIPRHSCGIVCGLTIPFTSASAGWLPRPARFLKVNHGAGSYLTGDR